MSGKVEEYKIVILGSGGVGKSAITVQYIQNFFVTEYDPTIEDSYRKHLKIDDVTIFLDICDTAGQEEYRALRAQYIRNADGFYIVYSITSRETFLDLEDFREQVLKVKDADTWPMIMCGNKCDLEDQRVVPYEELVALGKRFGCPVMETSASLRKNIDESFLELVKITREHKKHQLTVAEQNGDKDFLEKHRAKKARCVVL